MLGGIAATDGIHRAWYVLQLSRYAEIYNVTEWKDIEDVMYSFLWIDCACGSAGDRLWSEVTSKDGGDTRQ